jgi:hypothetical protein
MDVGGESVADVLGLGDRANILGLGDHPGLEPIVDFLDRPVPARPILYPFKVKASQHLSCCDAWP